MYFILMLQITHKVLILADVQIHENKPAPFLPTKLDPLPIMGGPTLLDQSFAAPDVPELALLAADPSDALPFLANSLSPLSAFDGSAPPYRTTRQHYQFVTMDTIS